MSAQDLLHVDRTGFPMLWMPRIAAFVHALPVTKVQLELFLSDARDAHLDKDWYFGLHEANQRVTARDVNSTNYWRAFATGLTPNQAERYATWCGPDYRLPTEQEWFTAFGELQTFEPALLYELRESLELRQRARDLVRYLGWALDEVASSMDRPATGEVLTAMRYGVLEWVTSEGRRSGRFTALGEPNPTFFGNLLSPERGEVLRVSEPSKTNHRAFGFRLVYRPETPRSSNQGSINS
jgi:hypothetical protein